MSIQAYQRAATQSENPRDTEYRTLATVTANLLKVKDVGRNDLGALSVAIQDNRRLWSIFALDCAQAENQMGHATRAQIISLAVFVDRHCSAVLREGAEIDPLIDINRTIMEGLAGR
ncbi:MAG: flagellar biosynthesis regulator FlaF [Hyphomonadaceae bacterium]|nr:MAG: flagellar protein FlaF [Caulobacteraceae bacterium]MBT9445765.1 flagellar biosynthesis regulator FlaF [Hyphomonadaceae bacterium]TPW06603.1 MAG: flagellar protein FlaF [Alphaproteobacteria bacterium]